MTFRHFAGKTCPLKVWASIEKNMSENGKNMYMESELRELQQQTVALKKHRSKVPHLRLAYDAGMLEAFKHITGANTEVRKMLSLLLLS